MAPVEELVDAPTVASGSEDAEAGAPLEGRRLAHHRVDALLGRGGMGAVYRGFDLALERPVAVKVLTSTHRDAKARFMREARAQAKVRHPNVVPIHYVGEQDDVVFLSMDLIDGAAFDDHLRAQGPLDPEEALDVIDSVCLALEAGHKQGLVHRDVKPSNILRTKDGLILLADFGLAKAYDQEELRTGERTSVPAESGTLTKVGAIVGTPAYMAPEQARGETVDHRADMYALGVTLYELITGTRPFTSDDVASLLGQHLEDTPLPPRTLRPDLSPRIDALVLRLLAKTPDERFATYAELRHAIDTARHRRAPNAPLASRALAALVDLAVLSPLFNLGKLVHLEVVVLAIAWGAIEAIWGTTIGKKLFALKTVDRHDEKPMALRMVVRAFVKLWGPLVAGFLGLVPILAVQVTAGALFVVWLVGWLFALGPKRLAFHDRLMGTRVTLQLQEGISARRRP